MRGHAFAVLLLGLAGCFRAADDCRNTLTCPEEPKPVEPACDGTCVPGLSPGWGTPFLVWMGAEKHAPKCPDQAPRKAPDMVAPPPAKPCGACACESSTGSCALPTTATAEGDSCANTTPATPATPTDPPVPWDGSCTAQNAIPAAATSAQSLIVGPLSVVEEACKPKAPIVPKDEPISFTFARTCYGTAHGPCDANGDMCVPARPDKAWKHCVLHEGAGDDEYTMTCPMGYPAKRVFGMDFTDARGCSTCACGAPQGSSCASMVQVYTDGACAAPLASLTVTAASSMCVDVPAGYPMGSKSATPPEYSAGTCTPSGGQPTGAIEWVAPMTFCCLD